MQILFREYRFFGFDKALQDIFTIGYQVVFSLGLTSIAFFFPLTLVLFVVQIFNLCTNTTTHERLRDKYKRLQNSLAKTESEIES